MGGISLLVIERSKGVTTRQMDCMGVWSSGTSYVSFEDVLVPVENVLGQENKGFQVRTRFRRSLAGTAKLISNTLAAHHGQL